MHTPNESAPLAHVKPNHFDGEFARHPKMKVLAVDDEALNVEVLEAMLTDSGYTRVRCVSDARQVLAECDDFEPDLILLDLMMPHCDGFEILRSLRESVDDSVPVIILTGDSNEETRRRALRAGATDFLLKPFDRLEMLLRIGNLLQMRQLQLQLDNQRAALEEALRLRTAELRDVRAQLAKLEQVGA
jgi:putative two-component system response regulator